MCNTHLIPPPPPVPRTQHAMTPRCLLCLLAALLEATTSSSAFGRLSNNPPIVYDSPPTFARGLNLTPVYPMLDSTLGVLSYLAFGVYIIMLFIDILGKKDPLRSAALLLKRQVQLYAAPSVFCFSLSPVCLPVSLTFCLFVCS